MPRFTIAAALMLVAGTAVADPVEGLWRTQPDDNGNVGHVEIYACDAALCGVIRRALDGSGADRPSDNIGKRMIWDMQAQGDGRYSGGKIWAPDRDKTYNSRMMLSGDALEVSGCVLGICRSQDWTRLR